MPVITPIKESMNRDQLTTLPIDMSKKTMGLSEVDSFDVVMFNEKRRPNFGQRCFLNLLFM